MSVGLQLHSSPYQHASMVDSMCGGSTPPWAVIETLEKAATIFGSEYPVCKITSRFDILTHETR